MAAEIVLDASVAAKLFFLEAGSDAAQALALSDARLIAPDLLWAEMASIAGRRVRADGLDEALARRAVSALGEIVAEFQPMETLAERAFELAARHGVSAYDATYLALAEQRGAIVVTADARLVAKARAAGLSARVRLLEEGERP
ncbi:type II toxin-antitoxin system VapC family toxin [Caulobacter hibisci]|uniref:Ribonuclease VapC n=1 Tax=Caulobacter hibisci TaxID=2035993 RepID=A0ABS0T3E3_9CAUL|nr:type II toxin-antitoxin system VapC family toxin [Caulobacter hibisci]MBI1686349.1 type II toxin-antitoxin system VapC family toxin [Caulobacter hibisci]